MSGEPMNGAPLGDRVRRRDPLFLTRLLVGLWVIALGAIFLAGNLGWIDTRQAFRIFWPMLMVLVGTSLVVQPGNERTHRMGWVFIGVGIWIFAGKIGWINVSFWQLAFPLALLALGGLLVWRAFSGQRAEDVPPDVVEEHAEYVRCFAVMSGTELRPVSRPFRGADLSAVMAGVKLDLTGARMEGDSATIDVFAFWGGMEIFVPPDWTVSSKVATLMGGFVDKRRPTSTVPTKTLVITGFIVMSGIEVKN
jgi:predicted membrane protein